MPFQSEKQRRYLHANHPEIANRWEAKYGLGGIAELNAQLNDLPEYYIPAAQGGLIPSHEAGIYGLAEGGQLVKPGPGRPGYGGPHETAAAGKASTASSGGNGHHGNVAHGSGGRFETANTRTTPTKSQAPDQGGHSRFEPGSGYYGETVTTSTPKDTGGDGYQDPIITLAERKRKEDLKDRIERGPGSDEEKYDSPKQHLADIPGDLTGIRKNLHKNRVNVYYKREAYNKALATQKAKMKKWGILKAIPAAVVLAVTQNPK